MTTLACLLAGVVVAIYVWFLVARVLDRQGAGSRRLRVEISLVPPRLVLEVEQHQD
jgi:hypothetical protein